MNVIDLQTDYNDTANAANREAQEKRCSIFLHFLYFNVIYIPGFYPCSEVSNHLVILF